MNQLDSQRAHWENIFNSRSTEDLSWFQSIPETSLDLLGHCGLNADSCIIDVGAGDSRLVDELLDRGFQCIHALDISAAALQRSQVRLGDRAVRIKWVVSDVLDYQPSVIFDAWHDRAAFHFLTSDQEVQAYAQLVTQAVRQGGHLIIGTFSMTGPNKCSGLDVRQYSQAQLEAVFAAGFVFREARFESHLTPAGQSQDFIFCRFQRRYPDV